MPAARSPAQVEAARRNGARSRGPVTAEGKARSRMNALRHGLAAKEHLLLDGEDPTAWDELLANLIAENEPETGLETRLLHRLAAALWRQDRADRLEQALFASAPRPRFITEDGIAYAAPEETFDLQRLAAVTRYRAQAAGEASRLQRELRALRAEARTEPAALCRPPAGPGGTPARDEALAASRPPEPGNDNAAARQAAPPPSRNEPEPAPPMSRKARRRLAALARRSSRRAA